MHLGVPSARLAALPAASLHPLRRTSCRCRPFPPSQCLIPLSPRRTIVNKILKKSSTSPTTSTSSSAAVPEPTSNPILDEYLKKKQPFKKPQQTLTRGDLAPTSIFETEQPKRLPSDPTTTAPTSPGDRPYDRDPAVMAVVLDPRPEKRRLWERRKIIQTIRRGPRISRTRLLKRTERESLTKSHFLKTSVKKLGMLARQIAGRPVEEALVQMRFSKKKAAKDVLEHLEHARNEAVVRRGMGLGELEGTAGEPIEIETKDGKRKKITDRTGIYIDQAWVGRGPYGAEPEYRARGRVNVLKPPHTSISVLLKENVTRIRLSEEKQRKRANRKLWVQLPDRPIVKQHSYYTW